MLVTRWHWVNELLEQTCDVKPLCPVEDRSAQIIKDSLQVYLQSVNSGSPVVCCLVAVTINGNRDKVGLEPLLWQ